MKNIGDEVVFKENGIIQNRAKEVLDKATVLLEKIEREGLFTALEKGIFADIKRPKNGGKGLDGVCAKGKNYSNPFDEQITKIVNQIKIMSGGLYSTEGRDFDQTLDLKKIKPYGDTMNDGKTQLSFTLPVPAGDEAIEAAKQLMKKMGFENPQAVYKWISGKSLPSLDNIVILSRLLHTSIEDILVIDGDIVYLLELLNHRFNDKVLYCC